MDAAAREYGTYVRGGRVAAGGGKRAGPTICSVLLISHRFSTVRAADRIYVLREGQVVESGTHESLMAAAGTYAELFTLQATPYQ